MALKEKSLYLSNDYKLGWDYDEKNSTVCHSCSILYGKLFKWKIENVSDCIKEIFVSTKDFVQLFMDRRQFVFDFMDFLIKNHGKNDMIFSSTKYRRNSSSKLLAAFDKKYADLFKTEDYDYYEDMDLNDEQNKVPCSIIIFSNSGKMEIDNTLMKEIDSYLTTDDEVDKYLRYVSVKDETEDVRFDILVEQIFQLYWLIKLVNSEFNYQNFKKKFEFPTSENIQKRNKTLKIYNQKIKNCWNQTISRCSEILEGSTKTESELYAELSPNLLIVMRNEFVIGSAFQMCDLNDYEQISRLKLLADDSDFENASQNESSEENQAMEVTDSEEETTTSSSKSQTTSFFGYENSGKIVLRKRKQDLSENSYSSESTTITMNNMDYRSLQLEMAQLLKMSILLSNDTLEPFVKTHDSIERVLLGFGSHQNRTKPKTTEASEMFVSPCPLECSIHDRQWICINCGEFFKTQGFQVICSCGTTHVINLKLECFDHKHPKDFFPCEKIDATSAFISGSRKSNPSEFVL